MTESLPPGSRLKELAVSERPQERMERLGSASLSDSELLAMLLRSGTRGNDVLTLAGRLLQEAGSLSGLVSWKEADFRNLKGIGRVKALQLMTVMEIARRVLGREQALPPVLNQPDLIWTHLQPHVLGLSVEKFWVLCLNRKNRLLRRVEVTSGTAGSTLVHPREVFREAIRASASAVICAHNHPSGDPSPSTADIRVTRQLREASVAVEIELLDHVIVGTAAADPAGLGYYSFRAAGLL
jgi:DNA repair protein RadC